jgi:hypothetical protein
VCDKVGTIVVINKYDYTTKTKVDPYTIINHKSISMCLAKFQSNGQEVEMSKVK